MKQQTNKKHQSNLVDFIKLVIADWWWVALFLFVTYFTYDQIRSDLDSEYKHLLTRLEEIKQEREIVLQQQTQLKLSIQSQMDPEWIKLTLKKRLGVVPEGQKKVYFKEQT
ncbi:MAG: hypothetical protein HY860_04420 [Chlamydiales bacterium]|nr:hypothetical protein [Chlamydiales bacterium]